MENAIAKYPRTRTWMEVLKDRSDLPEIVAEASELLEAEKKRRQEFYEWLTEDVKAEFINGEVVVHSPVKRGHLKASKNISRLASTHVDSKKLGDTATEKGLVKLTRNDYEPDFCFWSNEKTVGFNDDTMFHPAPDFVIEIWSKGTKKKDKTIKFEDYARHGVREYWMIDPKKKKIEQYRLDENRREFGLVKKYGVEDRIESFTIEGFNIPVLAIFDDETNLKTLVELLSA